jgi:receptor protein-tyrosine kinase
VVGKAAGQPPQPEAAPTSPDVAIDMAQLERLGMIDWSSGRSRIAEEFRIVQSQLLKNAAGIPDRRANLAMITSAHPGEGKSFTALNIAVTIARHDERRALLVDVDGKRGSIGDVLGLSDRSGLLDLVTDPRLDPEALIVQTGMPNLALLPFGRNRKSAAELLASRKMAATVDRIATCYADRFILFDTAPCLSNSDPHRLAPLVGQTVLVIEAGTTQADDIEAAIELVRACPIVSLLLNKLQISAPHSFGYYSYAVADA